VAGATATKLPLSLLAKLASKASGGLL